MNLSQDQIDYLDSSFDGVLHGWKDLISCDAFTSVLHIAVIVTLKNALSLWCGKGFICHIGLDCGEIY